MAFAACLGVGAGDTKKDIFFPGRGETSEAAVMRYCRLCSVTSECDDYATRKGMTVGVWGGKRRTRDLETGAA